MKKLLMALALSALTVGAFAQTASEPAATESTQGTSTDIMGAQEEVYPEGVGSSPGSSATESSTTVQEEEENVGDPTLQDSSMDSSTIQEEENVEDPSMQQDSSTIQEEVDSENETMRSDTMEGSQSPQQSDNSSEGISTP